MRTILTALLLSLFTHSVWASPDLLKQLDKAVDNRFAYQKQKEESIHLLRKVLTFVKDTSELYSISAQLFNTFRAYNNDSCLYYAEKKMALANSLHQFEKNDSKLNLVEVMCFTGMYKEALDYLNEIDRNTLSEYLLPYYYHLYRTMYGYMADYAVTQKERQLYEYQKSLYRDSILSVNDPTSLTYAIVLSDKYNTEGDYDRSIKVLLDYESAEHLEGHDLALTAYCKANTYKNFGDAKSEKEQLIISSIKDLESAVREYVSLPELAVLLYDEGDVKRAYKYMKCSLEDAIACNARLRTVGVSKIYLIIEKAYQQELARQKRILTTLFVCISILVVCLALAVLYVYRQMRRLASARNQLHLANRELQKMNVELTQMNHNLVDSNFIKEEYIGHYMDLCSIYLEKIDNYRRNLNKIANTEGRDKLLVALKSTKIIDQELREFYENFDNTFLHLFPSFVTQFNALLQESEQIVLKPGERLNTELRIYALIRLGIVDSVKIAHFLRYSVTTIYNYRTRNRNRALGAREEFENKVMKIEGLASNKAVESHK